MKKLFFALTLVAGVLAFTSCEKGNEPELKGKVYHYHGISHAEFEYEHDVYISIEDNGKMTMKWVGVKATKDAEPVTLYLYNGEWEGNEQEGYHIHCDALPQLPDGKPFKEWESFDIDGWCSEETCSFDYHINGGTMGIFDGERVKDNGNEPEDKDAVTFKVTGELRGVMFPVRNPQQQAVITLHPKANTVDVKFVQARIASEEETPQDIYIRNMPLNSGNVHINLALEDGSPYKPFPKSFAYAVMDEQQTTFNMHFGSDDEKETQVYLVFNAMLK